MPKAAPSSGVAAAAGAPVSTVPALLQRLRVETRAAHDRVEAAPGLAVLLSPDLTLPAYAAALLGQLRFHTLLQRSLPRRLARLGLDWPMPAHALLALRADLAAIGFSHTTTRGRAVRSRRLGMGLALGRGFGPVGALYVLEGSLLGGRVIGRHVQQTLGVAPGQGGSFFCGTEAEAARERWRGFAALLAALPSLAAPLHGEAPGPGLTARIGDELAKGALRGFALFSDCLLAEAGSRAGSSCDWPGGGDQPGATGLRGGHPLVAAGRVPPATLTSHSERIRHAR